MSAYKKSGAMGLPKETRKPRFWDGIKYADDAKVYVLASATNLTARFAIASNLPTALCMLGVAIEADEDIRVDMPTVTVDHPDFLAGFAPVTVADVTMDMLKRFKTLRKTIEGTFTAKQQEHLPELFANICAKKGEWLGVMPLDKRAPTPTRLESKIDGLSVTGDIGAMVMSMAGSTTGWYVFIERDNLVWTIVHADDWYTASQKVEFKPTRMKPRSAEDERRYMIGIVDGDVPTREYLFRTPRFFEGCADEITMAQFNAIDHPDLFEFPDPFGYEGREDRRWKDCYLSGIFDQYAGVWVGKMK